MKEYDSDYKAPETKPRVVNLQCNSRSNIIQLVTISYYSYTEKNAVSLIAFSILD